MASAGEKSLAVGHIPGFQIDPKKTVIMLRTLTSKSAKTVQAPAMMSAYFFLICPPNVEFKNNFWDLYHITATFFREFVNQKCQ